MQTTDILLALILLFTFLIWLRENPQYIAMRRKWRLFKKRMRGKT